MNKSPDHADAARRTGLLLAALAPFAILCVAVLSVTPRLVEVDDYAYRASIVAVTQGHLLTLSPAQAQALSARFSYVGRGVRLAGPGGGPPGLGQWQWIERPGGRWISEKNPGYPYLVAPFQAVGAIRLAPLAYGGVGCLGLFFGARRWLGPGGGAVAVGLFCASGAALLFAWRDYMPTFTETALLAAGTGTLLWAMLADEARPRRRILTGLAAFAAIEAAVFVRYTDIVVLACAVVAVLAARQLRPASVPAGALWWWAGSVAVFAAGLAWFDDLAYGGPLRSGYRPGEISFALAAVPRNLRVMPAHLIEAMPMLLLGLAALAWIAGRRARLGRVGRSRPGPGGADVADIRRDFGIGLALAGSWFGVWGLYAAYTWTTQVGLGTVQTVRFYAPAIGAVALLGAWLLVRAGRRWSAAGPAVIPAAAIAVLLVLGLWSYHGMLGSSPSHRPPAPGHCNIGQPHCPVATGREWRHGVVDGVYGTVLGAVPHRPGPDGRHGGRRAHGGGLERGRAGAAGRRWRGPGLAGTRAAHRGRGHQRAVGRRLPELVRRPGHARAGAEPAPARGDAVLW